MAQVGIFVGTVYGNALMVAEEAQTLLIGQGHQVELFEDGTLAQWQRYADQSILLITSTTGQGGLPDNIVPLYQALKEQVGEQPLLGYGVIALGDSSYDTFCGAGHSFDALLQEHGAQRIGELLEIDAIEHPEPETAALPWIEQWGTRLNG